MALNTGIFLYFCINKDNLNVNGLFSFHLVFYKSDIYPSKWLKKDKCMRKKVAACYDPPPPSAIQCWGSSPLTAPSKVGKFGSRNMSPAVAVDFSTVTRTDRLTGKCEQSDPCKSLCLGQNQIYVCLWFLNRP